MVVNNDVPLSRRYRTRAEECRRIAGSLHGAETQLKLLRIAVDYDWMAMRAAAFELQQANELERLFGPLSGVKRTWPIAVHMSAFDNKADITAAGRLFWSRLTFHRPGRLHTARKPLMLELYHNNISVNAQKVRIVLAEKSLEWTGHHLSFAKGEHLTTEYKALNPRGLVPVLVHDGHAVIESSVICSYLDEVFPDPPLTPKAPIERATMRIWCKLPDDVLHIACGTVSFAISFGEQLKKQAAINSRNG